MLPSLPRKNSIDVYEENLMNLLLEAILGLFFIAELMYTLCRCLKFSESEFYKKKQTSCHFALENSREFLERAPRESSSPAPICWKSAQLRRASGSMAEETGGDVSQYHAAHTKRWYNAPRRDAALIATARTHTHARERGHAAHAPEFRHNTLVIRTRVLSYGTSSRCTYACTRSKPRSLPKQTHAISAREIFRPREMNGS